jgi:hypothetical protein
MICGQSAIRGRSAILVRCCAARPPLLFFPCAEFFTPPVVITIRRVTIKPAAATTSILLCLAFTSSFQVRASSSRTINRLQSADCYFGDTAILLFFPIEVNCCCLMFFSLLCLLNLWRSRPVESWFE